MEDAGLALAERGRVLAEGAAAAARFYADEFHGRVVDEGVEHPGRIGAAADAGDNVVRQLADLLERLLARLLADDALEIAHHHREGMWAGDAADDVMGGFDAAH